MAAIWRSVDNLRSAGLAAVIAFGLASSGAMADDGSSGMPNFGMTWDADGDQLSADHYDPNIHATQDTVFGTFEVDGVSYTGWRYVGQIVNSAWTLTWDCIVNEDPFVVANITVANNLTVNQSFSNYMNLGVVPINPGSFMNGSVSAALSNTVTPFSPDATLSSNGNAIYQAFIDPSLPPPGGPPAGEAVATLWGHPTSFTTPTATNQNTGFAPTLGPSVLAEIGLRLQFTLSALDSVSVTGIFEVQPVPGPTGLAAFTLFGVLTAGRRRRR
jgi:hypothetical protein